MVEGADVGDARQQWGTYFELVPTSLLSPPVRVGANLDADMTQVDNELAGILQARGRLMNGKWIC